MDDLITKFFQGDLSEAEEQALSERLSSSVEDALRFGQHAEASYRYYGLPEPRWPGEASAASAIKIKPWMWLGAALTGLALWGLLRHQAHSLPNGLQASMASSPDKTLAMVHSQKNTQKSRQAGEEEPGADQDEASEDLEGKENAVVQPAVSLDAAKLKPVLTPVNLGAQPGKSHTNLSVVLRRTAPGQVTLRVLNPEGIPVVLLYDGLLQPGNWSFDWDGKLPDGRKPDPGKYKIQVTTGKVTKEKNIRLR